MLKKYYTPFIEGVLTKPENFLQLAKNTHTIIEFEKDMRRLLEEFRKCAEPNEKSFLLDTFALFLPRLMKFTEEFRKTCDRIPRTQLISHFKEVSLNTADREKEKLLKKLEALENLLKTCEFFNANYLPEPKKTLTRKRSVLNHYSSPSTGSKKNCSACLTKKGAKVLDTRFQPKTVDAKSFTSKDRPCDREIKALFDVLKRLNDRGFKVKFSYYKGRSMANTTEELLRLLEEEDQHTDSILDSVGNDLKRRLEEEHQIKLQEEAMKSRIQELERALRLQNQDLLSKNKGLQDKERELKLAQEEFSRLQQAKGVLEQEKQYLTVQKEEATADLIALKRDAGDEIERLEEELKKDRETIAKLSAELKENSSTLEKQKEVQSKLETKLRTSMEKQKLLKAKVVELNSYNDRLHKQRQLDAEFNFSSDISEILTTFKSIQGDAGTNNRPPLIMSNGLKLNGSIQRAGTDNSANDVLAPENNNHLNGHDDISSIHSASNSDKESAQNKGENGRSANDLS